MQALKYKTKVESGGQVTLPPLYIKEGTLVEIIILVDQPEEADDLLAASESSLSFWDNPIDDEVWNDA